MRVTTEELRQIIQEELTAVLDEKKGKKRKAAKKKKRKKKKAKKKAGKQDACYHKVKARYEKKGNWPSAYGSGALVQCRNKGAANWGNKSESLHEAEITPEEEEELKDVRDQLKGAVKAHGEQAKTIDKALKKEGKKNCGCGQDPCKTYGKQK